MIEDLATLAAKSIEQEANKWLDKQRADGVVAPVKMSGEEKKELAVKAMQSLAPPGLTITTEQAGIAIEAVVQKVKSLRPPADPEALATAVEGTVYKSINPGSTALASKLGKEFGGVAK
jgi:hypothetical protein